MSGQYAAHIAVARAVAEGTLKRPSICSQCAAECRIEGHHPDYAQPLKVEWLCPSCHRRRHPRRRRTPADAVTLTIRIPREMKDRLKAVADAHYRSAAAEVQRFIEEGIEQAEEVAA